MSDIHQVSQDLSAQNHARECQEWEEQGKSNLEAQTARLTLSLPSRGHQT